MRHSVTTPGGFFIGLGGIVASLLVAYAVYAIVLKPASNDELRPQQIAQKLVPPDGPATEETKKLERDARDLLASAAAKYNGGKKPNINELEQFRGVIRYREAQKALAASAETLNADSNVKGPDQKPLPVLKAAKAAVLTEIQAKKPVASAVKVDLNAPAEIVLSVQTLPNLQGGGAHTVTFPEIKPPAAAEPVPPAAPATPPAPSAAAPAPAPALEIARATPPTPSAPAPNRPPLLNGTEPTK